jgi:tetratricopeptide (TPR) repeat protein
VPPLAAQPARAAAPLPAAAPPPAGADFAPPEQRGGRWRWVLGAVALVILAGIVAVVVAGPPAPPPVDEAAPSATLVPVADLFTSCNDTVAAEDWAGAIAACRRVYARDAAYAGLADKLAAAYVGRGKQRLADSGDLSGAESDFGEALRYKSDDEAAQQQAQRVYLYKEGDKAITAEDWENAVGQLGAVYGDDPDYLSTQGERAVRQKLGGAWRSWGRAALAEDDKPSAAQRCAQALQILPDDADATRCVDDAGGLPAAGDQAGDFPPGEGPEGMPPGSQPPPGAQPPPR